MRSFNVLEKEENIFGNFFLEASAGTGKTFAIEHLFVRHLLESKEPLMIEEILVVTFTNAAVFDLKRRIYNNLAKAHSSTADSFWILEDALNFFDRAQIFTIHEFCLRMLKKFLFKANIGEKEGYTIAREKILHFLRYKLAQLDFTPFQVKILTSDLDKLISRLIEDSEKEIKEKEPLSTLFESFKQESKFFEKAIDNLASNFELLLPYFRKSKKKNEIGVLVKTIKENSFENFEALLETKMAFLDIFEEKNRRIKKEIPNEELFWVEEIRKRLFPIVKEATDFEYLFWRLEKEIGPEIKKALEEEDILSPDAILIKMNEALGNEEFLNNVRDSFKVAIIDEFQDTDPIQFEIFQKLFLGDKKPISFYLIGDPKQSIYGFRKADIYTYLKAIDLIENVAGLDTNFRSSPRLVSSLNSLFSRKEWLKLPKLDKFLPYLPVKAGIKEEASFEDNKAPIHFFIGEKEEEFLPSIASEILKFKKQKIAILVNDRYQAEKMRSYLNSLNIDCFSKNREPVSNSFAVSVLRQLFLATISEDIRHIKAAIIGPYFRSEINEEFFKRLKATLVEDGLPLFFNEFFQRAKIKDRELYEDTMQLVELILEEKPTDIFDFFDNLRNRDPEILKRKGAYSEGFIEIMTIHKAKGLEFDIVFALSFAKKTKEEDEEREAEKFRLLYVALTRAKKRVYVPLIKNSLLNHFFSYEKDIISECLEPMAKEGLVSYSFLNEVEIHALEKQPFNFTPFPSQETKTTSPLIVSFSSLRKEEVMEPLKKRLVQGLEGGSFSGGAESGIIFHSIFAKLLKDPGLDLNDTVIEEIEGTILEKCKSEVIEIVKRAFLVKLDGKFCLKDVSPSKMFVETEFLFPEGKDFIKGFIDLFFFHEGKYYLLDWKSNFEEDYSNESLKNIMDKEGYFLQASIYTKALSNYLSLFEKPPFETLFGGAFYFFLRAPAVYHFFPNCLSRKDNLHCMEYLR